jgi:hypothetical protein
MARNVVLSELKFEVDIAFRKTFSNTDLSSWNSGFDHGPVNVTFVVD